MNWYAYCGNSAMNMADPLGLAPIYNERSGTWTRETKPGDLYPIIPWQPSIQDRGGPFFSQHQPASCIIAATLNLCLAVGSVPQPVVGSNPLAFGAPVDFTECTTDFQAERWVEAQFEALCPTGSAGAIETLKQQPGFGFEWAARVLGNGWNRTDKDRVTHDAIIDKVKLGKAVMIAVDLLAGRVAGRDQWHAIVIIPTPKTCPLAAEWPYYVVDSGWGNKWVGDDGGYTTQTGQSFSEGELRAYLQGFQSGNDIGIKQEWIYQN
jgi:hypothetical protein